MREMSQVLDRPARPLADLLEDWRQAERRWEQVGSADEVHAAALDVVRAWAAYQDASPSADPDEFILVTDDEGSYVAATGGVRRALGFEPEELLGRRVADLTAVEVRDVTPAHWAQFLADGRQDGVYRLSGKDGSAVSCRFQARAHHPVPGFHTSRLSVASDART